ncbi:MAG: sigma 54-interacting transcriptional regulator [Methylococcaceae bacterium]|nr:sigma 54-interacting transcriptional regulator [Methylococcaceae bacterium]
MNTISVTKPLEPSGFEFRHDDINTDFSEGETGLDRPRQAWQWMRQTLQPPGSDDWVRREVAASWRRCLEEYHLHFTPLLLRSNTLDHFRLGVADELNPELIRVSALVDQHTRAFIGEAGLTFCLMDADCRLLSFKGNNLGDCPMGKLLTRPLADWSEPVIGNNGMGSAAILHSPIAFCGEEHYLPLLHPFATAGFPLLTRDGQLLAVMGLLSDQRISPGVLKSLICMLGNRIQATLQDSPRPAVDAEGLFRAWPFHRRENPAKGKAAAENQAISEASPAVTLEYRLLEKAVRLQERRIPILVVGESGAGKEHLIRMAHETGPRRGGPLIALNCASIPRELIESELFGYASGSFTGARREGKVGKFLLADKGTLFLDEIGDMNLDLQAVLLRVLESSEFFPVGASKPVKVDVQIFAATNVPIQQAVREGNFRRDLYYRLNGAQLILPPLRERHDKWLIIQRVLEKELALSGLNRSITLDGEVKTVFLRHPWPGNIRQLSNVIRSSLFMTEGAAITRADLPDDFLAELGQAEADCSQLLTNQEPGPPDEKTLQAATLAEWELRGIKAALAACRGNLTQTARVLGITRGTLYKKMANYGLSPR